MTTSYDDVIYPSYPYFQSQPDHLATIARFFGLRTPPPQTARVLELGCASGGNLLPLAEAYPDARFIGIDLSARQVEMARATIGALGFANVEVRVANIADVTPEWGQFDYIICHGVYSWVPDEVQDRILELCARNLSPEGVAYISYNTYPGWHMRGMIREIMCFHAARFTQPEEQLREARMLLDFLAEASAGDRTPYSMMLSQETDLIRKQSDGYLYHDHLEENNSPCYFFEFAQKVKGAGLQYLGDAVFSSMFPQNYPPKVLATLNRLARDVIQMEQYLDFVRNRMFRSSILCHAGVPLVRNIDVNVVQEFHISGALIRSATPAETPSADAPPADGKEVATFTLESGVKVTSSDPVTIGLLDALARAWPGSVPFDELAGGLATAGLITSDSQGRHRLAAVIIDLLVKGVLVGSIAPARCVANLSGAPKLTPLARHLAAKEGWLPTRRHAVWRLDEVGRRVAPLLNGQRTRDDLVEHLLQEFRAGKLPIKQEGELVRDTERAKELITRAVGECLERFRMASVLVG